MDVVTFSLAKQYTDSQRLAYTEKVYALAWDGDITASNVTGGEGMYLAHIGDPIDLDSVSGITINALVIDKIDGTILMEQTTVLSKADLVVHEDAGMICGDGGQGWVANVPEDTYDGDTLVAKKGATLVCLETDMTDDYFARQYVSRVEFEDIIHTIDPKFIPSLDSLTLNGADGKQYKLTVDETGTLVHTAIE